MKKRQVKTQNIIQLGLLLILVILVNIISHFVFHRFDLTEEKRFTLTETTENFLKDMEDIIFVTIYLDGENMPAGFRRLQKATIELMDEFKIHGGTNVEYEFLNPSESPDTETRQEIYRQLASDGLQYFNVTVNQDDGTTSTMPIFASAMVSYRTHGQQLDRPVNFFQGSSSNRIDDEIINRAIENLEYEFSSAMRVVSRSMVPRVGMITGHDELTEMESYSLFNALSTFYRVDYVEIDGKLDALIDYSAIIVADPKSNYSDQDKFIIDQFVMRGGRVLWLVDAVKLDMNALADSSQVMSHGNGVRLYDILYNYGVKYNNTVVLDLQCIQLPINIAREDQPAQFQNFPFFHLPLISANQEHAITRNLNMIMTEMVSPLDTVGEKTEIKKEILLTTSEYSAIRRQPVRVAMDQLTLQPELSKFPMRHLPIAVLVEGNFTSLYKNRISDQWAENEFYDILEESSAPSKMIMIGDGDIARNPISYSSGSPQPMALGFERYSNRLYSNKDFLLNCMNYLLDDEGVMGVRSREVQLRLMDYEQITEKKMKWKLINLIAPISLIFVFGIVYVIVRKKKYSGKA